MKRIIRRGVKRSDIARILRDSKRPEEQSPLDLKLFADYEPDAVCLEIDGQVEAAGGVVRNHSTGIGLLWLASTVDLKDYRKPLLRFGWEAVQTAMRQGLRPTAMVNAKNARARRLAEHVGLTPKTSVADNILYMKG